MAWHKQTQYSNDGYRFDCAHCRFWLSDINSGLFMLRNEHIPNGVVWIVKEGWPNNWYRQLVSDQPFRCASSSQDSTRWQPHQAKATYHSQMPNTAVTTVERTDGVLQFGGNKNGNRVRPLEIPHVLEIPMVKVMLERGLLLPDDLHLGSHREDDLTGLLLGPR